MRKSRIFTTIAALLLGLSPFVVPSADVVDIGEALGDFSLRTLDGDLRTASNYPVDRALLVIFFSTECPTSRIYAHHMARLHADYGPRGVTVLGVDANFNETPDSIAAFAGRQGFDFPVLVDPKNVLADRLDAASTPHAFLFDADLRLRYKGEIDDGFGRPEETTSRGLYDALDALLAGNAIATPVTKSIGCIIRRVPRPSPVALTESTPTFHRDVLPFLQENCQSCHHEGGIGRVAFDDYTVVQAWAPDMRDSIRAGDMPPWPPREGVVDIAGSRALAHGEADVLFDWIDAGMPEGDPADAPEPLTFKEGWQLGEPDIVLVPEEAYALDAVGTDEYRCFVMPLELEADQFVKAIEVLPGAREVVHHVSVYIDVSGKALALQEADPKPGYYSFGGVGFTVHSSLGGWAPGNTPFLLPEGVGRPLPKNCSVVMQIHYHKSGRETLDLSKLGIYLAREEVTRTLEEEAVASRLLFIPPGASNHKVTGSHTLDSDVTLLGILPHMHLLGKEMKVTATTPDGATRPLIWVDDWEFEWQETYVYKEPMALPRGTRINLEAIYDNSADNPRNPNRPPKFVRWGEESSDEMCIAFLYVTRDE